MADEKKDDKTEGETKKPEVKKKKKASLSLNMGDVAGKVVKKEAKEAAPKETKTEEKKEDKKKCDCPDCSCKPKVATVPFAEEDEDPEIQLNIKGKQTKLENVAQEDFLAWVENVMPMTKDKFKRLQKIDFSNYAEKRKLFDAVAKFHEDTLKTDLKNRGYTGFPLT